MSKILLTCPFHKEETPSCIIDSKDKTFSCLSCGSSGQLVLDDEVELQHYELDVFLDIAKKDAEAILRNSLELNRNLRRIEALLKLSDAD